jgi:hypothetical protein
LYVQLAFAGPARGILPRWPTGRSRKARSCGSSS